MATKPPIVPTFNTGGANRVAPNAGKRILGWLIGEQPPSSYFNWLQGLTGDWLQYLSDGVFTGAHSVSGAFAALSTMAVTGLITAAAGLTAAVNQHITISGTGRFKHGDIPYTVSGAAFQVIATSSQWAAGTVPGFDGAEWSFTGSGSGALSAPIDLPVGKRIKTVLFHFNKGGSAAGMTLRLRRKTAGGATATVATITNSTSGASYTTDPIAPSYVIAAGEQLFLEVLAGNTAHIFGYAIVTFDEP